MEDAKLQIDRFGFNETSAEITGDKKDQPERLSDKLTVLINDIGIAMKKLDYALHRGKIYRKDPASRFNKLMLVFYASVLLLMINCVITLSKCCRSTSR